MSAFAPILIADERERLLPDLQSELETGGMVVPPHWYLEVANMVLMAVRRGRLQPPDQEYAMRTIRSVNLSVDEHMREQLLSETWRLAELHRLTIYDAAYLELAARRGLPLATSDQALIEAAGHESVALFGR